MARMELREGGLEQTALVDMPGRWLSHPTLAARLERSAREMLRNRGKGKMRDCPSCKRGNNEDEDCCLGCGCPLRSTKVCPACERSSKDEEEGCRWCGWVFQAQDADEEGIGSAGEGARQDEGEREARGGAGNGEKRTTRARGEEKRARGRSCETRIGKWVVRAGR